MPDLGDEVGGLGHADEVRRLHHAAFRVKPAQQGFAGLDPRVGQSHDGLIDEEELAAFVSLFPRMIETTVAAVNSPKQKEGRTALEGLCDAIEANPGFLKPHLNPFCNSMLRIAVSPASSGIHTNTKQMAIETLLTLAEVKPGLARKVPQLCDTIIPIMLQCITIREDNDEWNLGPEEDPEDNDAAWGEESLDRISLAMGGKPVLPPVFKGITNFAQNQDSYKHRMTAMIAISLVAEGSAQELFPKIPDVLKTFIPRALKDHHPRVRATVAHLIGQLATDFKKPFTKAFGKICLSALMKLMTDAANPRAQAMALSALINWCDHCSTPALLPFADPLCQKVLTLLQTGNSLIEEAAVTATAAISDVLGAGFRKYYPAFAGPLKQLWKNRSTKHERELRGKTLEAITLVGINIGREMFLNDALELTKMLVATRPMLADDDPLITYFQQSSARLAKVLRNDFVQFLPDMMPPLIKSAEIEPEIEVHDANFRSERKGWHVMSIGDKTLAINDSKLEDKTTALNMMYCYAVELQEGFINYVPKCASVCYSLIFLSLHLHHFQNLFFFFFFHLYSFSFSFSFSFFFFFFLFLS